MAILHEYEILYMELNKTYSQGDALPSMKLCWNEDFPKDQIANSIIRQYPDISINAISFVRKINTEENNS